MKHLLLLSSILLLSQILFAQNITVNCDIDANTTWDADTVFVDNTINVLNNITLTVSPGVIVMFNDFYPINIQGSIISQGTETETILYSVIDTTGYSTFSHTGWDGFLFDNEDDSMSDNDTSRFSYCEFSYGKETNDNDGGGAIKIVQFNKVLIDNCIFHHNFSIEDGGALNLKYESVSTITDCVFHHNFANRGGGAINIGCYYNDTIFNQPVIKNCIFENNVSNYTNSDIRYGGGAMKISGYSNALIENCSFKFNHSKTQGGAMIISGYATPFIVNNIFYENTAIHNGGAIAMKYYANAYIINNNIMNNISGNFGGGLSVSCANDSLLFINNIVGDNQDFYDSYPSIYLSEPYDDKEKIGGDENMVFRNNDIQGGLNQYSNIIKLDNIDTNPLCIDITNGDMRLPCNSPCMDAGLDTTDYMPKVDFIGENHLINGAYDIGAYETQMPDEANLEDEIDICDGEILSINAGYQEDVSYLWNTEETSQIIEVSETDEYSVTITNSYLCSVYDSIEITVNPLPEIDLGLDMNMYNNEIQTLNAGSGFKSYLWNTEETTASIDIDGSIVSIGTHEYWVEVENEFSCTARDTIKVSINNWGNINNNNFAFNVYPNPSNGIINIEAIGATVRIYDLNGRLIREEILNDKISNIDLTDQGKGIYMMSIYNDNKISNMRIVIQ
jgi:hypothetical protein